MPCQEATGESLRAILKNKQDKDKFTHKSSLKQQKTNLHYKEKKKK
jgi:hypothetical protein